MLNLKSERLLKLQGELMLTLALILFSSMNASAQTVLNTVSPDVCTADEIARESLSRKPFFVEPRWHNYFAAERFRLFDPEMTVQLGVESNLTSDEVSSSQEISILADGLRDVKLDVEKRIREGKPLEVKPGKTYYGDDHRNRVESRARYQEEVVAPKMYSLLMNFIGNLQRRDTAKKKLDLPWSSTAFRHRTEQQAQALTQKLKEFAPGLIEKIGIIESTEDTTLPISYRDGIPVKLRFHRAGDAEHITIYPRMILKQLNGEDRYFIEALEKWNSYVALQIAHAEGKNVEILGNTVDKKLLPLLRRTLETGKHDLKSARWVHERISQLSLMELFTIMDLLREVRYGDVPRCQDVIQSLNQTMRTRLSGNNSTAKLKGAERATADKFARDVVFYQDIFNVLSESAAVAAGAKNH